MDGQMTGHLQRIQAVEKEVARLNGATALKEEVTKLRSEMKSNEPSNRDDLLTFLDGY
jgi:hypothetical protein